MIRNYYTLLRVADELQFLIGAKLIECFSQEKNELILSFFKDNSISHVQFSADTVYSTIYFKSIFHRARSNSVDLFSDLIGHELKKATIHENNRLIEFDFGNLKLIFIVFGGSKSNTLLIDKKNAIKDSFKDQNVLKGTHFQDMVNNSHAEIAENIPVINYISKIEPKIGKEYLSEIIYRVCLNGKENYQEISDDIKEKIKNEIPILKNELLTSVEFFILKNNTGKTIFSLIPLTNYPEVISKFDSVNEAIRYYISKAFKDNSYQRLFIGTISRIENILSRYTSKLTTFGFNEESKLRSEKYFLWGNLLSSQREIKSKAGKSIILDDWDGNKVEIPLKEELNILDNGIRYFEKSKSILRGIEKNLVLKPILENKIQKINSLLVRIKETKTTKEIERIMNENRELIGFSQNEESEASSKFRKFELGEGFVLFVGKNAANNDELTMHFAKPNDIWMHARGSSGSHSVLRLEKNQRPPKQILQKAASITAYYSGAKNAKYTPVAYTYKKYVHKPKGANPGSVVISKEEVIMAEPKLPE